MKFAFFFLLIALSPLAAREPVAVSRVVATSPDQQYEVVVADDAWCVRNVRTHELIGIPDDAPELDPPYTPVSGGTALWSPDSRKVVFAYRVNKHGGDSYFAFVIDGAKLVALQLPEDAIPLRWTAADTLVCSVRTEAALTLDPKTGAFGRATSAPSDK